MKKETPAPTATVFKKYKNLGVPSIIPLTDGEYNFAANFSNF